MTETQLEREVLMHFSANALRKRGLHRKNTLGLARGLMVAINKYKETEIEKVIKTVEE